MQQIGWHITALLLYQKSLSDTTKPSPSLTGQSQSTPAVSQLIYQSNAVLTYQFQQQPLLILQYFPWLYWGSLFLAALCFSVQPNECYQTVTALAKYTNSQEIWLILNNHMSISGLMFLSMLSPRGRILGVYGAFDFSEEFLIKISTAVAKKHDW